MRKIFLFYLFLGYCFEVDSQIPYAGSYDAMNIAIDSANNKITGYYENRIGDNGQFSCIFLFNGSFKTYNDKTIVINSYFPEDGNEAIKGKIVCKNNSTFSILLNDDHGGCWNVQTFRDEPVNFDLTKKENWIDIKIVKSSKVFFYTEPSDTKKSKAYVLKNDVIKVLKRSNNWLYVVYEGKSNTYGWIKSQDCY